MSVLPYRKSMNLPKLITNKFFPYSKSNQNNPTKTQPSFGQGQDQLDLIGSTLIDFYENFDDAQKISRLNALSFNRLI